MLKPDWVFPAARNPADGSQVLRLMRGLGLDTVCESARCPNRGECLGEGTATFLILGGVCTRRCGFCAVAKGTPSAPQAGEAEAIAEAVRRLGLDYAVVTSVTRDDLPDGGAAQFAASVRAIRGLANGTLPGLPEARSVFPSRPSPGSGPVPRSPWSPGSGSVPPSAPSRGTGPVIPSPPTSVRVPLAPSPDASATAPLLPSPQASVTGPVLPSPWWPGPGPVPPSPRRGEGRVRGTTGPLVEVLVPDFAGASGALETVLASGPAVLNHNLETVPRLYARVRPGAEYARSLDLLRRSHELAPGTPTKSGLMVGLGEDVAEVVSVMGELAGVGIDALTVGQYLQPTRGSLPVQRYWRPEEFAALEEAGRAAGIAVVVAGPLVRSSHRAREVYLRLRGGEAA